jgi:hypothetical protein
MIALVGRGWRHLGWYLREFFGDTAYERYRQRHAACSGSGHEPLSQREYYKRRGATRGATGCC